MPLKLRQKIRRPDFVYTYLLSRAREGLINLDSSSLTLRLLSVEIFFFLKILLIFFVSGAAKNKNWFLWSLEKKSWFWQKIFHSFKVRKFESAFYHTTYHSTTPTILPATLAALPLIIVAITITIIPIRINTENIFLGKIVFSKHIFSRNRWSNKQD